MPGPPDFSLDKALIDGKPVGGLSGLAVDRDGTIAAISDKSALYKLNAGAADTELGPLVP
ncbi:hypothetical protein OTB20_05900 [Streptomyces sp. H27-H1]|uniref:hypothetical protein n=1 Tax=Streptomyces sp. H27-H1 TaxID=2996461 RepID=UPI0022715126|nr:hypothetical protein [Streptomyces sp. H27-H1]MCY0925743.1 hypothetical protein [Streptomyces sp. H27-H1]